jgi:lipopolysaccharide export system protein LptA
MVFLGLLASSPAKAQQADTGKTTVFLNAEVTIFFKSDTDELMKFIGNAVFRQGTDTLYCDSLYKFKVKNVIEAFSNVRVAQQGGTQGTSDYLRYTANTKDAFMQGHVTLTDGKNNLKCEELNYNLGTKVAVYDKGGVLHNDSTTVTSRSGVYNVKSKEARFKGNVVILDPEYNIHSEDVEYNTDTKVTRFYALSTVVRDSGRSILRTSNGTYDGKNGIAHFVGHSSIWSDNNYIEGDTLNYDKTTGYGLAIGNVISIDTEHHSVMYCGRSEYYRKKRVLWAMEKPVLLQVNGKDSLYMRADTFYSAPMVKAANQGAMAGPTKYAEFGTPLPPIADELPHDDIRDSVKVRDWYYFLWHDPLPAYAIRPYERNEIGGTALKDTIPKEDTVATYVTIWMKSSIEGEGALKVKTKIKVPVVSPVKEAAVKSKVQKPVAKKASVPAPVADTTAPERIIWEVPPTVSRAADTMQADTTAPIYFIGYHHVLIFSDSLQGKCDSIVYTRSDSTIRMIYNPIAWSHKSQITGDTILMMLDSNQLRSMYVPNNAIIVSQSGPVQAELYDQVQGKTITAYFKNNAIDSMLVKPEAETIYFNKDEGGAYMGVSQAKSALMRIFFDDQKIKRIKMERDVHQTMTPMEKADLPAQRLSRFKWLEEERPKSKEELFR